VRILFQAAGFVVVRRSSTVVLQYNGQDVASSSLSPSASDDEALAIANDLLMIATRRMLDKQRAMVR